MVYITAIIAIIAGVFLDQYTKFLATVHLKEKSIPIIEGIFKLEYLENSGAAFGLFQNQQLLFLVVGIVTLALIVYTYIRMPREKKFVPLRMCMVSITTGAIGNMIDRIRFKYVVDFLNFELIDFPIFNVADIFATVATFALIILCLFYYKEADIDRIYELFSKKKEKQEQ